MTITGTVVDIGDLQRGRSGVLFDLWLPREDVARIAHAGGTLRTVNLTLDDAGRLVDVVVLPERKAAPQLDLFEQQMELGL